MTKIVCTVTNDLSYDQRMIRICSTLSKAGYQVLLVGRKRRHSIPLKKESYQQKRIGCWFNQGKLFYLEYNIRLFFLLLFSKFDILNAIDLDTLLPAYFVSLIKKKPCVYDAHEYFTEVPELVNRPRTKKVWEKLARFIIPKLKYCYTVGPELARIFQERYGPSFEVIRNVPFQKQKMTPLQKKGKPIILYQGVLNEGRGLEVAIEAMASLNDAELWLIGEGDLSKALRQKVQQLQLEEKVKFLGYIPPDMMEEYTLQATIGLNLIENNGLSYYYSLANKAFDYIQSGIPSINMAFPEYMAINEQFQVFYLLNELNPEVLKKVIHDLLDDTALYKKIKTACIRARVLLNWEEESPKLLTIYQNIVPPKP